MEKSPTPEVSTEDEALAKMEARLSTLEDRLETADAENTLLTETMEQMKSDFVDSGFIEEPEAEVLYDPYYSKRPYQIIGEIPPDANYPEGQVLGWKNESHREQRRGWRGWIPMEYGDQYTGEDGVHLSKYIVDVPPRLEGSAKIDNNVRRADSLLCRLDKRIFVSRQKRRETLAKRNVSQAGTSRTNVLRDGVSVTGDGLRSQARPAGGFKMGEKQIVGEHHQNLLTKPQED